MEVNKVPQVKKKVISHVSCSQSDSLMADIYSGWKNGLVSAGFMLTAGSKANCAVLMQSHIAWVSRINKTNGLGCTVHNCWSLCSKLHFIRQSHNANEKYGCGSSATLAASERWPRVLCVPFMVFHFGNHGGNKTFPPSFKRVFEMNRRQIPPEFPWQENGTKWMVSFYPRISRHLNCALTPPHHPT